MTYTDMKIYVLNFFSFTISLTNIDTILKIALLLVTIGYTAQKWYLMNKNKDNK